MIRINMFSQADSVQGQGVGSAYKELVRLLRTRLVDDFYVTINKYGASDLTHYHTINPTYFANSFYLVEVEKLDMYIFARNFGRIS